MYIDLVEIYLLSTDPAPQMIDRGAAEVNIGILRSISHMSNASIVNNCFIIWFLWTKKKQQQQQIKILAMDYVLDSPEFLFLDDE